MRNALMVAAALGVLVGALYLSESLSYSLGTLATPGPGLFPLVVGVLMLIGFLGVGVEAALQPRGLQVDWPEGAGWWRIAAIFGVCAFYLATLLFLGHAIAGTLLCLAILHVMGMASWRAKIGFALAMGLGSYGLFVLALGVPLPPGIWFG